MKVAYTFFSSHRKYFESRQNHGSWCEKMKMKTGWLFFKLAFAARGPFDSSPLASREGSSYIYTGSTLTSRWHQRGQALWRTTGPPINLATFLFSILDSKRRLGTFNFQSLFGLILLILFSFLMALFFDWKVVRVLMVVGLSSPLSKSSFILFYSWCFCTPKAR